MLSNEKMRDQASKYLIDVCEEYKECVITRGGNSNWVAVSLKRALQWVEAGIEDLNCKSQKEMKELIEGWLAEGLK